jgi:hypothetical protein
MSQLPPSIAKQPALKPAEDYYRLRREGIGFIEQMGSRLWTDYNSHDPGITILEALCYAITDLAFRTGWDIKDILTPALPAARQPFPHQPFFTARDILTVNPTTPDDYRRLLIDLELVRNAWAFCRDCACDSIYYAWCDVDRLEMSYQPPAKVTLKSQPVSPRGLYDALLELESDPELGDLNDRKITSTIVNHDLKGFHPLIMELRFPEIDLANHEQWALFLKSDDAFAYANGASFKLKLIRFGATKTYDVMSDPELDEDGRNSYVRRHWSNIFYVSFEIELVPTAKKIVIENAALRVFSDITAKNQTTALGLKTIFEDKSDNGFIQRYRKKAKAARGAVASAKAALQAHRNLDEDYCRVKVVGIEEVAVCADVEVKPDADIERVQARIWFEIEQYFNPPVPFYTLQELLDAGEAVEEIFNGPALASGFIRAGDLEKSALKSVLRVSDIINRLMDIDGVLAVNQLQLTKYDSEGSVVRGNADPTWSSEGKPIFDANKVSASWLLFISKQHQPRLYLNGSRFLFFKNGLPFLPRMDEANDILTQLRGEIERQKIKSAPNDLPIPTGTFRDPQDYFPVQHSLPLAYGIGPDGLPAHASDERRAQAKQLQAYLMVFEQLLGDAFAQVARVADLFSLDPNVERTYFVREFSQAIIQGYDKIVKGEFNQAKLETMTETVPEFHERRNRFLDHIMARFGEQFNEYALLLTNLQGQQVALDQLINVKIAFLNSYPAISSARAKAFNYKDSLCSTENQPGIKQRISRLLGYPGIVFDWPAVTDLGVDKYRYKFQLLEKNRVLFRGYVNVDAQGEAQAKLLVQRAVIERMSLATNYKIVKKAIVDKPDMFVLRLKGKVSEAHGRHPDLFVTEADAAVLRDELLAWSSNERTIVVEHLLLRPKFPGDALYTVCADGPCQTCGDEDPYSFRLTFVLPGWTAPFNTNMEMRGFADRLIRQETPAHLLSKICWIGIDEFALFEDAWCKWLEANALFDWTEERLAERVEAILVNNLVTDDDEQSPKAEMCKCAAAILAEYGMAFFDWLAQNCKAGKVYENFSAFTPDSVTLCTSFTFKPGTAAIIEALLKDRYNAYKEVAYRLWLVVNLLGKLSSTYPAATLHDWDEGSDQNPVRLGKTALGSL